MKYDFDSVNNRVGTNSVKWDIHPDVIPLWVADMDFQVLPEIKEALSRRVEQGIFGYTEVPESYMNRSSTGSTAAITGTSTVRGFSIPQA